MQILLENTLSQKFRKWALTIWGCEAKYIPLLNTTTGINKAWKHLVHSRIILECAGDVELNHGPPKIDKPLY